MIVGWASTSSTSRGSSRQLERVPALRDRLFTEAEKHLPITSLAARFAAKEAARQGARRAGRACSGPTPRCAGRRWPAGADVEGTVAARAAELGVAASTCRCRHDAGIASAVVVAERDP